MMPRISRSCVSGMALAATLAGSASAAYNLEQHMPDPIWRAAERLAVVCNLETPDIMQKMQDTQALCAAIARIANDNAPLPVGVMSIAEAQTAANTVLLLVNASVVPADEVTPGAPGRLVSFTIRLDRRGAFASPGPLFGVPPAVAPYDGGKFVRDVLLHELKGSMSKVLPWMVRPANRGL